MNTILIISIAWIAIIRGSFGNIIQTTIGNMTRKAMLSGECRLALNLYNDNINNPTDEDIWALKMWDASSKILLEPMIRHNNYFGDIGNFDQCIGTKSISNNIIGKYCLVGITVKNTNGITDNGTFHQDNQTYKNPAATVTYGMHIGNPIWAICVPNSCSDNDVLIILNDLEGRSIVFDFVACQTRDDVYIPWTTEGIIGLLVCAIILAIMVLSTSYDLLCRSNKMDLAHPALIAFSVYTNGKKLFHIRKNSGELSALNGMRVMSMVWIIMGHTEYIYSIGPIFNLIEAKRLKEFPIMALFTEGLPADTFLTISGVLVTYVYFKQKRHEKNFNILMHYFHRYIRLTPALAGALLVSATLLKHMGSGPRWGDIVEGFENACQKYWWSTLLYIQNYSNTECLCLGQTWYLDVDMQLYLLSPLILFLLRFRAKTALALLGIATLASIFSGFWTMYNKQLPIAEPRHTFNTGNLDPSRRNFFLRTDTRAAPWLMGTILGYLLTRERLESVKIPEIISKILWASCFIVMTMCVFANHIFVPQSNDNELVNALRAALQKPIWCLCLCWIIWACATDRGGVINIILSYPMFQFLNQFTYSIFILHFNIMFMIVYAQKTPFYYSLFNLIYYCLGNLLLNFGLSIVWVLTFESPILVLEKIVFENKKK